ncbi:hypothetical protein LTR35_011903 [Friedmanniomyces endolithicus]|nr:hypothetical protein LTR35_011903 [Friedmanniomyces endolithicus]
MARKLVIASERYLAGLHGHKELAARPSSVAARENVRQDEASTGIDEDVSKLSLRFPSPDIW